MQTFMPYADFNKVARVLDVKRLGKQRIETMQIYYALTKPDYGWKNHPIVKMWKGHEYALLMYGVAMSTEWIRRGYKDTMRDKFIIELKKYAPSYPPRWVMDRELQISHQSNLIRKDAKYYKKLFPRVPDNLPYKWVV